MSSLQCLLTTEALLTSHVKASVDYFISYSQDPFQHTKVSTKKCTTVLCGILSCWSLLCGLSSHMYNYNFVNAMTVYIVYYIIYSSKIIA